MAQLLVGFSRINITPMMGIPIRGYFIERIMDGVLDELEINAVALSDGDKKIVMLSADLCGIRRAVVKDLAEAISAKTGLSKEAIFIHATHTHTGPMLPLEIHDAQDDNPLVAEYYQMFRHKMVDAALLALEDLKPAKMGYGIGQAPNIAFIRRFRMKDGTIHTNPGVDNPDIIEPVGKVDERVNVLRFDREGADTIVIVNVGNHPDTVGGCKISADWPGFLRKTVEKTLDNVKCVFFNGAQGDVNHVNVHPRGGDLNGMFIDFDDVSRGYAHTQYMGRVVAGGVLQAFDKVKYVDVDAVKFRQKLIRIPSNQADPKDLPEAHRIHELHIAGRDAELPYQGMMLTTKVAEAGRMVRLENGPEYFEMELSAVAIGPVAFIGVPGEPFNGVGLGLKANTNWDLVCPSCLVNGAEAYFPMMDAYEEGGYEAKSSPMKAGCAELIVEEGNALLNNLAE